MHRNVTGALIGLIVVAIGPTSAGEFSDLPADCPTVVRAYFAERSQVDALAAWAEPWEVHHDEGWLIVDVDADGFARLVDLGFEVLIDEKRTAELCTARQPLEGQTRGIPGYPCYRTVEETIQTALDLVAFRPDLASFIDVGDSWEKTQPGGLPGYDMMVLRLTNSAVVGTPPAGATGKPRLFVTSSIHAREYTPAELMTRFAEYLVLNHGIDPDVTWILDEHEVHLMLHANPDGRKHAEAGLSWRKNTNENYCSPTSSDRGADLNRNFEFQWGCCGGSSGSQCANTYRGPSPASEPETQSVRNYAQSIFPDQRDPDLGAAAPDDATGVYLDIHSSGELLLWPWGFTYSSAANGSQMRTLGRRMTWFNGYWPEQAIGLYPTDGTTVDFSYGDLGVPGFVFELGTSFFQNCSSFEGTIVPDNLGSLLYAAKVVRTPYLTPAGPDVLDPVAIPTVVAPGEIVGLDATADDTRFNNANGSEPTQPIAAARVFVDTPPWQSGATPAAMTASDGAFDATVEAIEGGVDTLGLADGRHVAYLQAQDSSGQWGAVSAAFFWVLDPATAAHIAGTVTSAATGGPLDATVSTGVFTTETDPVDGSYDLMLPEGTYDLTVSAEGYAPLTVTSVSATGGATTPLDVLLSPIESLLEDDVEGGNLGWTAEGQWAITSEASSSPSHSWTDSPGGEYGNDWNFALTSRAFDLTDWTGMTLEFMHTYRLESGYDYAYVEVSADGGPPWIPVATYNGFASSWQPVTLDLALLDGAPSARIRFRIDTDGSVTEDGWHIDDIVLRGGETIPPGLIFRDGFSSGDTSAWSAAVP
jgi:hypothetical protein